MSNILASNEAIVPKAIVGGRLTDGATAQAAPAERTQRADAQTAPDTARGTLLPMLGSRPKPSGGRKSLFRC